MLSLRSHASGLILSGKRKAMDIIYDETDIFQIFVPLSWPMTSISSKRTKTWWGLSKGFLTHSKLQNQYRISSIYWQYKDYIASRKLTSTKIFEKTFLPTVFNIIKLFIWLEKFSFKLRIIFFPIIMKVFHSLDELQPIKIKMFCNFKTVN